MDALLDSEPNTLSDEFRSTLYHRTSGHPLFTLEILRGMQARGDLVRDADGCWTEGGILDWQTLPARVEAVIAERVGRLPEIQRRILRVASVEGQDFTAESVAHVMDIDEAATLALLSGDLARTHRLVSAQGIRRLGGHRASNYRFQHILFQTYLYDGLDAVERAHFHEQVGDVLEELAGTSGNALAAISPQLARHFEISGILDKAIRYYEMAGHRAIRILAYQEAVDHLTRALELLEELPASPGRDRQEVALRLAIATPIMMLQEPGRARPD